MSGSGNTFSITVNGFTSGQTISYACKFAFAGGLAVTKYFSYEVGDVCPLSVDKVDLFSKVTVYPNPVKDVIYVSVADSKPDKLELFSITGKKMKELVHNVERIYVDDLSSGLYLLKVYHGKSHSFHRIVIE
jgi:hypothetical protein